MKKYKTVIFGAGGHASVMKEILLLNKQDVVGYISTETKGTIINGVPVLCNLDEFIKNYKKMRIDTGVIAIGDNYIRKKIAESINDLDLKVINAIHPSAIVSPNVKIGKGVLICAGAVIQPNVEIGDFNVIWTNSSVSHNCILKNYSSIASNAVLSGHTTIGELTAICAGSIVREKIRIGNNSVIGAGAVVLEDIPDNSLAVGIPAKVIRKRKLGERYLK